jgi:hypothetical protein
MRKVSYFRWISLRTSERGDDKKIQRIVELLGASDDVTWRRYSKRSFATTFGGTENEFDMGQAALKHLIDAAIKDGRLVVENGKQKLLAARSSVPKAKPLQMPVISSNQ